MEGLREIAMGEGFPKSRRVNGVASLEWVCNNCSNGNRDSYGMLKVKDMVAVCNYCTVTSLVKPEWEE